MSEPGAHRARKGCYVVIGHDQYSHDDYLVGHYISLSRARKAARNMARSANGIPTSFSDIFFVNDSAGRCLYRVCFDDLPPGLRHPAPNLDMPASLPKPGPAYGRLFKGIAGGLLALLLIWQGKSYYDDLELSTPDQLRYEQLRQQFTLERPGENCGDMSWDRYETFKAMYEQTLRSPAFPRAKTKYLEGKLRFYEETAYRGSDVIDHLAQFTRQELARALPSDVADGDALYERNRQRYLDAMKRELPLREELGRYVIDWHAPQLPVVTHEDYRQLERALGLCKAIRETGGTPALGFLLDNGGGDEVPLDGYEAAAFDTMIERAAAQSDARQAATLHRALIVYQVMNWDVYQDAVQDSITRYRRFLDAQGMDGHAPAASLQARLLTLNPYEYGDEYKAYKDRTLRFLRASLTENSPPAAEAPSRK